MSHRPVLLDEAVRALNVRPDGVYLDATLGAGGHARAVLERLASGRLIGLDRDPHALALASSALQAFGTRFTAHLCNYARLGEMLRAEGITRLDGALFDLGASSMQFDQPERGFSFREDGPLDMRMGPDAPHTAAELLNRWDEAALARVLRDYGEERFAARIARAIVAQRERRGPLSRTRELADLIAGAIPAPARRKAKIHPATRAFQALRIAVNGELEAVPRGLEAAFAALAPGGRLAVIAFHSLEDRPVKRFMREKAQGCVCPPGLPVCACGRAPEARAFPLVKPSEAELAANPRARSARLRALERLPRGPV